MQQRPSVVRYRSASIAIHWLMLALLARMFHEFAR